jgi:hypothetical protein
MWSAAESVAASSCPHDCSGLAFFDDVSCSSSDTVAAHSLAYAHIQRAGDQVLFRRKESAMVKTLAHVSYISWRKVKELHDQLNEDEILKTIVANEKSGEGTVGASGSFFSVMKGNAEIKRTIKKPRRRNNNKHLWRNSIMYWSF